MTEFPGDEEIFETGALHEGGDEEDFLIGLPEESDEDEGSEGDQGGDE